MKLSNAIIISIVAHATLIALLAFNFQFSKADIKQSKSTHSINAHSVNAKNIERLVKNIKQKDADKKNKEIERLRKLKKEEEKIRKKRIEEENKVKKAKQRLANAEKMRKLEEKKAADAKKKRIADKKSRKKKKDADRKLAAKKKAEVEKKRKQEAERKRKKKIAEEKKKKLAEEKVAQQALEQEMQRQMEEDAEAINAVKQQQIMTEVDKFVSLIQGKIRRNWLEPETQGYCKFRVSLAPGGLVIGVAVLEGDNQHCESGQRAIYKSEPLPVSKDPDVFAELRSIRLTLGEIENNVQ